MNIFGWELSLRRKAAFTTMSPASQWISSWGGPIRESFSGAWQKNVTLDPQANLLSSGPVYACVTGIAADIAKLRIKLSQNTDGIWEEITSGPPWLPVLRKPNHYQTRIEFVEQWIVAKLLAGNAYILKERDQRGVVTRLYPLNPTRVMPLVATDGSVWYRLHADYLSGIEDTIVVPASEIIHDRMVGLWHPLVGIPPIYACALSATQSNKIQTNSTNQFGNASRPGGILTAPGSISNEEAAELKARFEEGFSGNNVGRLAVLGDGLKFEPMILTAESQQLTEQLKWTVEDVGRCFHYPQWFLGGSFPPYSSGPEALTMFYYQQCLQPLIEKLELCLDEGLELPQEKNYGTELDLDNLMRMDTAALFDANNKGVGGGWLSPDEARNRANYRPVPGGQTPYLQQQYWSLEQLNKRTAAPSGNPVSTGPTPNPEPPNPPASRSMDEEDYELLVTAEFRKELVA